MRHGKADASMVALPCLRRGATRYIIFRYWTKPLRSATWS